MDPAEEDVAGRLHQPLADHHALTVVGVLARAERVLEHRRLRLLDLEKQRVCLVTPEQQSDPGPGAHASHAHHLAGKVGHGELLEQLAPVIVERLPVKAQQPLKQLQHRLLLVGRHVGLQGHDQRRLVDDPRLPVDHVRQLGERRHAVPGAGLGDDLLAALGLTGLPAAAISLR